MVRKLGVTRTVLSHLGVFVLQVLGSTVSYLPPSFWDLLSKLLASILWLFSSSYKRNAQRNLIRAGHTTEKARVLARACFKSNVLVFFETLAVRRILARKGARIESRISPGAEAAIERIRAGKETLALAVSGHTGVWELLGAETARLVAPTTMVVAASLSKNPIVARFLVRTRRRAGIKLVERNEILRYLLKNVREKIPHIHVFLCDQHFKGGTIVPFMGEDACTVAIPATMIKKYDPPVLLGRCVRKAAGDYLIEIDLMDKTPFRNLSGEEAVRAIILACNKHIEESIAMAPEQWTWGHKRWKLCCSAKAPAAEAGA
jgi:lauroyl/myristoyl acyltransferase